MRRDGALPVDFPGNGCTEHTDAPACEDGPDGGTGCAVQVPYHEASQEECPDDQAPDDPHGVGWPILHRPAPRGWPGTHLVQDDPHGSASILTPKARRWQHAHGLIRRHMPCRGGVSNHPRGPFVAVLSLGARIGMPPVACGVGNPTTYKNDITLIDVRKEPTGRVRPCPWRARPARKTGTLTVTHGINAEAMTCISTGPASCSRSLPSWSSVLTQGSGSAQGGPD
jgi:hypothetical protein